MADFSAPLPQAMSAEAGGISGALTRLLNRELWGALASQILGLSKSFFNPVEFTRPSNQAEVVARIYANANRFSLLYGIFFLPVLLHQVFSSTFLVMGSLVIVGTWGYSYGLKREDTTISAFGIELPKMIACVAVTVVIVLLTGMLSALLGAIFLFSLVGLPHMALHSASAADAMDALELQPVAGYDSSSG